MSCLEFIGVDNLIIDFINWSIDTLSSFISFLGSSFIFSINKFNSSIISFKNFSILIELSFLRKFKISSLKVCFSPLTSVCLEDCDFCSLLLSIFFLISSEFCIVSFFSINLFNIFLSIFVHLCLIFSFNLSISSSPPPPTKNVLF